MRCALFVVSCLLYRLFVPASRRLIVEGGAEFLATALLMLMGCYGGYIEGDKPAANAYGALGFGMSVFMATAVSTSIRPLPYLAKQKNGEANIILI